MRNVITRDTLHAGAAVRGVAASPLRELRHLRLALGRRDVRRLILDRVARLGEPSPRATRGEGSGRSG